MINKLLIILFFLFAAVYTHASGGLAPCCSWLDQSTATGDWRGLRTCLEEKGITISSYYATDIGGNPVGGLKRSAGYSGFFDVGVALDLEKIACLKGTTLRVSNFVASGSNLSSDIGNLFCVQQVYAAGNYYFGVLALSVTLLNDRLTFEVGRLLAGDVFLRSELWQYYVTGGLNGNMEAIDFNIFFPEYKIATWAARVTIEPNSHWQLVGGIYNADQRVEDPDKHGLYFNMGMRKGVLAIGQINFRHHQTPTDHALPGSISLGGYYESNRFGDVARPEIYHRGNYGLYLFFDQMIFRGEWLDFEGPDHLRSGAGYAERARKPFHQQQVVAHDRPQGLTVWGAANFAPRESINILRYQLAGGLLYRGLLPCRPRDVTVFGVLTGRFSDRLEGQTAETVFELNHRFQLGRWCYITPDLQYVIKPNGRSNIPNALVLGIEMSINF